MNWFRCHAPIRLKLKIAFGSLVAVMAVVALVAMLLPPLFAAPLVAVLIAGAAVQAMRYRSAIADPYVSTVVRMEALAAGDLDSAIAFTDYQDCVGRMTRAMLTFRDNAAAEKRMTAEQNSVVAVLGSHLERVAGGDLTASIDAPLPGAYAELQRNFNDALESLCTLIGSVMESTIAIRTGSGEIAQASEDLARRTEAGAASLEQTSAAIAQMDGRLKATADAAAQTVERADGAIESVTGGRAVTDQAVQAMGRVSESAKGIDSVIEGLDKIAFQTRVLAMNAAVEAGRAGEAGRGFAGVADLVSALAMRAEEEAGRARDQLTATQTDIVAAVDMVQKVDGALAHIVDDVSEVHKLLGDMARDNEAQSSAITQISTAIASMDQSTQQNAAMVEQTSAAARNLNSEIGGLADQAARFRVDSGAQSRQSVARAAAAAPAKAKGKNGSIYVSPVKPLPAAAVAKLTAPGDDDWASF